MRQACACESVSFFWVPVPILARLASRAGYLSQSPSPQPALGWRSGPTCRPTNRHTLPAPADSLQLQGGAVWATPTCSPTPGLTTIPSIPAQHPVRGGNRRWDDRSGLVLCVPVGYQMGKKEKSQALTTRLLLGQESPVPGAGEPVVPF